MQFLVETLRLGLSNLGLHKLRSFLTALGIIFGVASVILMVAIGEGNRLKARAQIDRLGARNIILRSVKPPETARSGGSVRSGLRYGLTRQDVRRIEATVDGVARTVPMKQVGSIARFRDRKASANIYGTTPELRPVASLGVSRGRYLSDTDGLQRRNIAVIGSAVARELYPLHDPMGQTVYVGEHAFRVVGVLRSAGERAERDETVGLSGVQRDLDRDVHIPVQTARAVFGDQTIRRSAGSFEVTEVELTQVYVEVRRQEDVIAVSEQVGMVLDHAHAEANDAAMVVPLALLRQAERLQLLFNALMTAIASISLLVGGIGIMNIMLASVTERTREIGIRRALGATRRHINAQFLAETALLSTLGGVMGVGAGLGAAALLPVLLPKMTPPSATGWSVLVSVIVAVGVGIVFGLYPAVKAARQDPIVALRHD